MAQKGAKVNFLNYLIHQQLAFTVSLAGTEGVICGQDFSVQSFQGNGLNSFLLFSNNYITYLTQDIILDILQNSEILQQANLTRISYKVFLLDAAKLETIP